MFQKISKTSYPPQNKPLIIWDGDCDFCRYWILYLKRYTGDSITYAPYQEVHEHFNDIPVEAFEKAVQFVDTAGRVYSGLDSAYRSFYYFEKPVRFLHQLYCRSDLFAQISDGVYFFISNRRPLMYRLTVLFFGKNPNQLKPYWLIWTTLLVVVVLSLKTRD